MKDHNRTQDGQKGNQSGRMGNPDSNSSSQNQAEQQPIRNTGNSGIQKGSNQNRSNTSQNTRTDQDQVRKSNR